MRRVLSMKLIFFPTQLQFRRWLEENHTTATEICVGYHKVSTGKLGMTYSESVDQALCFGWIDGVRHSLNSVSYCNRFTPRKAKSNWSAVNIAKVKNLMENGRMEPAGIAAFEKREEFNDFSVEYDTRMKGNSCAWSFFENQSNWYKSQKIKWVMSAKQEVTRNKRLEKLIDACVNGNQL